MQTHTHGSRWVLGGLLAGLMTTALVVRAYHSTGEGVSPLAQSPNLIRGVTMALEATASDTTRVRFEVCGPDVTQIPRRFPLSFGFDATIRQVTVTADHATLAMQTTTTAQQVTVSLTRDPFTLPEAWKVAVLIDFAGVPWRGQLTIGASAVQELPPMSGTSADSVVVLGTRCEETYAAARKG
jgi:hypothetical protein